MGINILGTGSYLPEKILTNDELSTMVETNDEWITQRVGIKERRVSVTETAADMAVNAAKEALAKAGLSGNDIDLIVCATISSETLCPTVAGMVGAAIGAQCPAFDVSSACSGFLFALDTAAAFIDRGGIRNALVIGAERLSKLVDWSDRSTCVIFGDGAGAAVVTKGDNYLAHLLFTNGGNEVIEIPSFGGSSPFYKNEPKHPYIFMDGQETFKFAVKKIVDDIKAVLDMAGLTIDDIAYIVPHQANVRIIDYAAKRLKISPDKIFVNIEKVGNTSAASVPIALAQLASSGKLNKGDKIILCAFGGGLSSAACIIEW
ncbi:MAG: ketoacyl-ACP synthase III [Ruminococcaceae bacterium]|nr:ketoacyl-ACP synthase III [Oscillospiraceae bacterium]